MRGLFLLALVACEPSQTPGWRVSSALRAPQSDRPIHRVVLVPAGKPCATPTPLEVTTDDGGLMVDVCAALNHALSRWQATTYHRLWSFRLHVALAKLQISQGIVACNVDAYALSMSRQLLRASASMPADGRASGPFTADECIEPLIESLLFQSWTEMLKADAAASSSP